MRRRILFICGSMNQTTQMHQISEHLPEYEHSFSPSYCDGPTEILRRLELIEFTITGNKLAGRCRDYLQNHDLPIDDQGKNGPYDLVVTGTDLFLPKNIRDNRIVLIQGASRTRNPVCFISSSVSGSFLPDWREHRRPGAAMDTGVLRRERRISRLHHPKRRAPREDHRR